MLCVVMCNHADFFASDPMWGGAWGKSNADKITGKHTGGDGGLTFRSLISRHRGHPIAFRFVRSRTDASNSCSFQLWSHSCQHANTHTWRHMRMTYQRHQNCCSLSSPTVSGVRPLPTFFVSCHCFAIRGRCVTMKHRH